MLKIETFMDQGFLKPSGLTGVGWGMRLHGPERPTDEVPLNMALVIDRSGSMQGSKLARAKEGAIRVLRSLRRGDRLSIVTFSDDVRVLVPAAPVTAPERLEGLLTSLRAGGSTNLSGGWAAGLKQVLSAGTKGRVNRVIVLTERSRCYVYWARACGQSARCDGPLPLTGTLTGSEDVREMAQNRTGWIPGFATSTHAQAVRGIHSSQLAWGG